MRWIFTFIIFFSASITFVLAEEYSIDSRIDQIFREANIDGTLVILNVKTTSYTVHNPSRSEQRYVPGSTFKIPNSLIGLSVNSVNDVDESLPYGGEPQFVKAWEEDMPLRKAITISNVPIYKELARRIGLKRMKNGIRKIEYGNNEIGNIVDAFWLEGPLKISALEQAQFMARLARSELPFPENTQASVREIVRLEEGENWVLYGKTGWAKETGWWVGWVEKNENVYSFALNIEMKDIEDAPKRIGLGRKSLEVLGILE